MTEDLHTRMAKIDDKAEKALDLGHKNSEQIAEVRQDLKGHKETCEANQRTLLTEIQNLAQEFKYFRKQFDDRGKRSQYWVLGTGGAIIAGLAAGLFYLITGVKP